MALKLWFWRLTAKNIHYQEADSEPLMCVKAHTIKNKPRKNWKTHWNSFPVKKILFVAQLSTTCQSIIAVLMEAGVCSHGAACSFSVGSSALWAWPLILFTSISRRPLMDVWCSSSSSSIGIPARHKQTEHLPGEEIIFLDPSRMASSEASISYVYWRRAGFLYWGCKNRAEVYSLEETAISSVAAEGQVIQLFIKPSKCQRNQRGSDLGALRGKRQSCFITGQRWSIISCCVSHHPDIVHVYTGMQRAASYHSGAAAGCGNHTAPPGCPRDTDSHHRCWTSAACWSGIQKNRAIQLLFRATGHDPGFVHLYRFGLDLKWVFLYPASLV